MAESDFRGEIARLLRVSVSLWFVGAKGARQEDEAARYDPVMYRTVAVIWLAGWAAFSIPWSSFTSRPQVENVSLVPFKARRVDQIRNFLYYVPAGAIGVGLGLGPVTTVAGASALSGAAEVSQISRHGGSPR